VLNTVKDITRAPTLSQTVAEDTLLSIVDVDIVPPEALMRR
jgi:hypothetical protein